MKTEKGIIFGKNLAKLQRLFLASPLKKFSYAEIRKRAGLSKATTIKWLKQLVRDNFVKVEEIGRSLLFYANLENPIAKQTKILFNVAEVYETAKNLAEQLECEVYLFGSAARGEDTEKSDIDLLIIGDKVPQSAVMPIILPLEESLKRKIAFQIFTRPEWAQATRKDKPFYERVEKDKIRLA